MKKFLTLLSIAILTNIFALTASAEDAVPGLPDAFELEEADDSYPTLTINSGSTSSSSGSYVKTTTTPPATTPPPATTAPAPAADNPDREISETGPEMIYLIILGLLLIGGYQFAMKRK